MQRQTRHVFIRYLESYDFHSQSEIVNDYRLETSFPKLRYIYISSRRGGKKAELLWCERLMMSIQTQRLRFDYP